MTRFLWRLPTRGDSRHIAAQPTRVGFEDLLQVIDAAEIGGLDGVLAPYDPLGEESWVVAGAALRATRLAHTVVEFEPSFGSPVYAAKMSTTLQRLSAGRLGWQLAVEPDPEDARRGGDRLTTEQRYARADEFLTVARGVWNVDQIDGNGFEGTGFDFDGTYFHVANGGFRGILSGLIFPTVYIRGIDDAALALGARHADVQVLTESPTGITESITRLRSAASERHPRVALELPVIARETTDEAWDRAQRLVASTDNARAHDLGDGRWAGFRAAGFDSPIGLVGSYDEVGARLRDYAVAGIDTVILDGRPHIEEVHRTAEHLLHRADPDRRTLHAARNYEEVSA